MGLAGLVRLAGSLTVLAAATGLGAAVSLDYRRRIQLLTQLRRMFLLLAGEIRSSRTPAAEAFGRMAGRMEDVYKRQDMSMKVERKLHDMRMDVELRECTARSNSCDLTVGMIDTKSIE